MQVFTEVCWLILVILFSTGICILKCFVGWVYFSQALQLGFIPLWYDILQMVGSKARECAAHSPFVTQSTFGALLSRWNHMLPCMEFPAPGIQLLCPTWTVGRQGSIERCPSKFLVIGVPPDLSYLPGFIAIPACDLWRQAGQRDSLVWGVVRSGWVYRVSFC